jgi:hypothetical protein
MRLLFAISLFFRVLCDRQLSERLQRLLIGDPADRKPKAPPADAPKPARPKVEPPARSEALTLLATLQREARFVDLAMESLSEYSDAQIGAAARDVLTDCGQVLQRMFAIQPVVDAADDSPQKLPSGFDTARYRLTGNVAGEAPYTGRLVHHGWEATRCELPRWSGPATATRVVAPAEVEVA